MIVVKSTWDHIWPKTESMAYCILLWHSSGHKAHNALPASRVFSSVSEEPIYTKPHFKIFPLCMPLLGVDLSPGISFISSEELT